MIEEIKKKTKKKELFEIKKINQVYIKLSSFLEKVTQPVLVIHDKNDAITPYKPIEKVLKKLPTINLQERQTFEKEFD